MDKIGAAGPALTGVQRAAFSRLTSQVSNGGSSEGFGAVLARALDATDGAQQQASALGRKFQTGDATVSLEETMIAMQKANLSFQTMVQVRNRVISAYHDIMNMQV